MVKEDRKTPKKVEEVFSTDSAAIVIWQKLLEDFRTTEGCDFAAKAEEAFKGGIAEFRKYSFPELGIISPYRFKMWKQLESLLKKYRFSNDLYGKDELHILTLRSTLKDQERFSTFRPEAKPLVHIVLQRARKHARRILGKLDKDRIIVDSRFGKKSSIGCPLNLAYIDHKLTDVKAFTGSSDCAKWFYEHLGSDEILSGLVQSMGLSNPEAGDLAHETLNLVLVPKSWKSYRPITPLTLLGLFYSYGVGEQVTSCLKDEGLNISTLQRRHANLVRYNSVSKESTEKGGPLATADLRNASQSLVSDLLNRVLPREWYCAIKKTFSHQLEITGTKGEKWLTYTESVLPMGNGLTFPVETLVFYVILRAIAELAGVRGKISVYGDDLIYPSKLHKFVAAIFPLLKFELNLDKTFVKAPFRESCGTDFYRGVEVRPAFLPDESQQLSKKHYTMWLYKCYNALVGRWNPDEIPKTASFLLKEINSLGYPVLRVPPGFPDTAGVKVENPGFTPLGHHEINWSPVVACHYSGSRWYHFSYLTLTPKRRVVKSCLPYYWLALQGRNDEIVEYDQTKFWETDFSFDATPPSSPIKWETIKKVQRRSSRKGKVYHVIWRGRFATVASRSAMRISVAESKRESISDWF